tara:strand:+ start:42157 stop:43671 length:1515 start_codon:yes stop_codon:yes gene_type:complete
MISSIAFIFTLSIIITWTVYKTIGMSYALDIPDYRKKHKNSIPQIGGIIFVPIFILICFLNNIAPAWYLICSLCTLAIGAIDDIYSISWKLKLLVQLLIAFYISYNFWGHYDTIIFYNLSISFSENSLFIIFIIWFVGIYNAVNLIDGLDGLAGGVVCISTILLSLIGLSEFSQINLVLTAVILGFLILNQRPARLFMGDAGSLFLGFHFAAMPLLSVNSAQNLSYLNMTPFIILVSYLIADTTRVFFTRILTKKSPMTADTIHFHHLMLKQSGSYLGTIGSIFFITSFLSISVFISFQNELSDNYMFLHMALLLLFILAPPVETYVPVISKIIKPFYNWHNNKKSTSPYLFRTIFMVILLLGLLSAILFNYQIIANYNWQHLLSIVLISLFMSFIRKDELSIYVLQTIIVLLYIELFWNIELNIYIKLFSILLLVSYIIFTLERRNGCEISNFSTLDLIVSCLSLIGIVLSFYSYLNIIWFLIVILALWFGIRFVLKRTIYLV